MRLQQLDIGGIERQRREDDFRQQISQHRLDKLHGLRFQPAPAVEPEQGNHEAAREIQQLGGARTLAG